MKTLIISIQFIFTASLIFAQQSLKVSYDSITDPRDSKTYKTVVIGTQTWMAENLNFVTDTGSWCYNNKKNNADRYGRLYNWQTALIVCPEGWHLPSDAEWNALTNFIGTDPGKKLKAKTGWESKGHGTDDFGFMAMPAGSMGNNEVFSNLGFFANWWTATENLPFNAWGRNLCTYDSRITRYAHYKSDAFSVRCVKNQ